MLRTTRVFLKYFKDIVLENEGDSWTFSTLNAVDSHTYHGLSNQA
jgi:hypothetical protein